MRNLNSLLFVLSLTFLVGAPEAFAQQRGARSGNQARPGQSQARQRARTRRTVRRPTQQRNTAGQNLQARQQSAVQLPARIKANGAKLSQKDIAHLNQVASGFERQIKMKFTPVVNVHLTESSRTAGVGFNVTSNPQTGAKGPTVIEVSGVTSANQTVNLVMSGGASGHVMQPKYGGRDLSVVEGYAKNDTVYLHHKAPGASGTAELVKVKSRGFTTQEAFKLKLTKGEHNLFYHRGGPNERSGGIGSEPELRQVKLIVK